MLAKQPKYEDAWIHRGVAPIDCLRHLFTVSTYKGMILAAPGADFSSNLACAMPGRVLSIVMVQHSSTGAASMETSTLIRVYVLICLCVICRSTSRARHFEPPASCKSQYTILHCGYHASSGNIHDDPTDAGIKSPCCDSGRCCC